MSTENWMQSTSMADTIWNARWRELILAMATGLWEVSAAPPAIITIHLWSSVTEIQRKLMETAMDMHLHTVETSYLKQKWTR